MKVNYKMLYEAAEDMMKKQTALIEEQRKYIAELEAKNDTLSKGYKELYDEYDRTLSICNRQQELLEEVFQKDPEQGQS